MTLFQMSRTRSSTLVESPLSTPTRLSGESSESDDTIAVEEQTRPKRVRPFRAASIALDLAAASIFKGRRIEKNKEDHVLALNAQISSVADLVSPLSYGTEASAKQIAQYSTNLLMEGLPELLKVLQDVASAYPFIALAVGAFRVAIELDMKRRENDKRINLLFLEMRDMMTALTELQDIEESKRISKDGKTIQERLQIHVDRVESDILDCANACDTYAKQSLLAKVFSGPRWDEKLQQYIKRFTKRRADIQFAVALHLGMNVDVIHEQLTVLDSKMDSVLEYLHCCTPPEERELAALIQARGGREVVLRSERLLLELVRKRQPSTGQAADPKWESRQNTIDIQEIRAALSEDPEVSISRNSDAFERKFEMQERELVRIQEIVHEENKLVIQSMSSGPHDKIRDNDLHNIWKEMRWRGNVKARHFVLALRDYCLERLDKLRKNEQTFIECDRPTTITEHDEWTLEYISVTRLQAIIEAFDDDASGFITVAEVNAFTALKPPKWSLLHWMAYWAVGWQMTMTHYVIEIDRILDKMFAVKPHVLPANRRSVELYLDQIWSPITALTTGFRRADRNDNLDDRFRDYASAEECRLRDALERVRYDIDAPDILQLVTGPGRIEKHLFPLLFLLLKRDYEIMRFSRTVVLHKDELWDSTDTLKWVLRAVMDRYTNLENLFKQQNIDPSQQFKVFASELFRYWHDPASLWSTERLREAHYVDQPYNDADEDQFVDPEKLLNHPVENTENPLVTPLYIETCEDSFAPEHLKPILGEWSGFIGDAELFPNQPMVNFHFHMSSTEFAASGILPIGTRFTVTGSATPDSSGTMVYTFTVRYAARYLPKTFRGRLSDGGRQLTGKWNCRDGTRGTFTFRRLPPDAMRFWPLVDGSQSPLTRPQVQWRFVCGAVQDQVRRKALNLHLLRERQGIRQRFLRVIRAGGNERGKDDADRRTLEHCYRNMTPSEARYYYMMHDSMRRIAPKHFGISCANCHEDIYGARIMCLDCGIRTTVDLCDKPACRDAIVGPDRRDDLVSPHLPSHRILKVRRVIHRHREFGKTYRAAQAALIRAEEAFSDADDIVCSYSPHGHSRSLSARIRVEQLVIRELSCAGCQERVSRPCWYCIECDDECFICLSCEATQVAFSCGHKPKHGLVRCSLPRDDTAKSVDLEWSHSRIDDLETKIDSFQRDSGARFDSLDGRLHALESRTVEFEHKLEAMQAASGQKLEALDAKLQHIEHLLSALSSKL
ncbi:hypothetical protein C8Q70DRAFT_1059002 [Cubamyces menziesii]|nr:hypothetical protein C8Q70DRAFT_1059002 [Cubamyces menziesii]